MRQTFRILAISSRGRLGLRHDPHRGARDRRRRLRHAQQQRRRLDRPCGVGAVRRDRLGAAGPRARRRRAVVRPPGRRAAAPRAAAPPAAAPPAAAPWAAATTGCGTTGSGTTGSGDHGQRHHGQRHDGQRLDEGSGTTGSGSTGSGHDGQRHRRGQRQHGRERRARHRFGHDPARRWATPARRGARAPTAAEVGGFGPPLRVTKIRRGLGPVFSSALRRFRRERGAEHGRGRLGVGQHVDDAP